MLLRSVGLMANSTEPDQNALQEQFDVVLYCLLSHEV